MQFLLAAAINQMKGATRTIRPLSCAWDLEVADQPPAVLSKAVGHLDGTIGPGRFGVAHDGKMRLPIAEFVQARRMI
jgi:hypothetical protein